MWQDWVSRLGCAHLCQNMTLHIYVWTNLMSIQDVYPHTRNQLHTHIHSLDITNIVLTYFGHAWPWLLYIYIYIYEPLYPRFLRYCWFIIIFWYSVMLDHPHLKYLDQFVVSRVAYPYTKNERHNWTSIYTPLCLYSVLIILIILEILTIYHFKVLCT